MATGMFPDLYKEWVDRHYRLKVSLQHVEGLKGEEVSFDEDIHALAKELESETKFEETEILPRLEQLQSSVPIEDVELALRVAEDAGTVLSSICLHGWVKIL
ncbi:hypothetical protein HK104_005007 [Borealophlyctis nickersoniae]|nr:hypothetical protein HK104_005007 [Borealophlyctis nickersoniae]